MDKPEQIVSRILEVLTIERETILSGVLSDLENIAQQKESLLSELLTQSNISEKNIKKITREAGKNKKIISAYLSGISSAKFETDCIRTAASGMETYDSKGIRKHSPKNVAHADRRV